MEGEGRAGRPHFFSPALFLKPLHSKPSLSMSKDNFGCDWVQNETTPSSTPSSPSSPTPPSESLPPRGLHGASHHHHHHHNHLRHRPPHHHHHHQRPARLLLHLPPPWFPCRQLFPQQIPGGGGVVGLYSWLLFCKFTEGCMKFMTLKAL